MGILFFPSSHSKSTWGLNHHIRTSLDGGAIESGKGVLLALITGIPMIELIRCNTHILRY
jgi:hypothetical protein